MDRSIQAWVDEVARLTQPDRVFWIDGSPEERRELIAEATRTGELVELDQGKWPGCYLHRSAPNDVARNERLTFVCTERQEDAGPTNNWLAPAEAYRRVRDIARGSMRGRTLYVIPYLMGTLGSPFSQVGVQLTDSIYVVLSMGIMARTGKVALEQLGESADVVRGVHAKAEISPERRMICHFPEDRAIWSVGSAYGGNALLGKKCHALRIASYAARQEGWLAEHMLILGVEDPSGRVSYLAAAFPSYCGKTNLAMMIPPKEFAGYRVWTVGDDIAWMRIGPDGRLWAVNPEAGFFGVAPGTNWNTNPNAMATIARDTLFTNVVQTPERAVWWEGMATEPPVEGIDWQGRLWRPGGGEKGAHPNARFCAPIRNCPSVSPEWENPEGVPISAIVFGGRRAKLAPLVYESFDWQHGVFVGATMASETTSAAAGQVGVVRRDPMAMLPFCGYNMGDYFAHWLEMGRRIPRPPRIFHVNWFRTDAAGRYLWPGYGENFRVVKWILDRSAGTGEALETPIGWVPDQAGLDLRGLVLPRGALDALLAVDRGAWLEDVAEQGAFLARFDRLPPEIEAERAALRARLAAPEVERAA